MKFDYFDESDTISDQINIIEKELAENPESVPLVRRHVRLLLDYQNEDRLNLAMSQMSILMKKNPDVESEALYVRTLRLVKKTSKAKQVVSQFLQKNPENPDLLEEQGRIWVDEGKFKEARKNYQKVLEMAPRNQRVRRAMLQIQYKSGESPDKILSSAKYLVELEESDKNIKELSHALELNHKHKEAIELLEKFSEKSPESFWNLMSTRDGKNASLPFDLVQFYFQVAIHTANEKKLKWEYEFEKNHKIRFVIDTDDEVDALFCKSNELLDKIIFDEKFHNTSSSESIFKTKGDILFYLRRFSECRYFLEKQKLTDKFLYFNTLFHLKEFDKASSVMSRMIDERPSSERCQKCLSDCFRARKKIEEYQKHYAIYEKLKRKRLSKTEDRSVKEEDWNFSNLTDMPLRNLSKNSGFYKSRTSKVLKIWNKYFSSGDIEFLEKYLTIELVQEIQVIRGINPYKNGLDFYEKLDPLIEFIERFNLQNKNKCKISVRVTKMNNAHDRYLLEKDHVWDIMTIDQINNNQTGEHFEVTDPEGIRNRQEEFERLWNDDDGIEIKQKNRRSILRKLAEIVENSGNESIDDKIKYEIDPSKKYQNEDKAVRDKVEYLLGEELWNTTSITNLEDDDFINKMHDKIKEELAEYLHAAERIDAISEEEQKIKKHRQWLLDNSSTSQKMIDVKNKKIKENENKIKNLKKEIENETHVDPLDELSDILEAVYRMAELRGSSAEELDAIREKRAEKYGRFSNNCYMIHDSESSQT